MWREKIKSILSWQKGREAKGRAEKKEFPELRGKQDKKELFQKAILQESRKAIQNPGCGWYHLYTFNAAQTGEPLYIACEEEELVLLRIDIGAFWGQADFRTVSGMDSMDSGIFSGEKKRNDPAVFL